MTAPATRRKTEFGEANSIPGRLPPSRGSQPPSARPALITISPRTNTENHLRPTFHHVSPRCARPAPLAPGDSVHSGACFDLTPPAANRHSRKKSSNTNPFREALPPSCPLDRRGTSTVLDHPRTPVTTPDPDKSAAGPCPAPPRIPCAGRPRHATFRGRRPSLRYNPRRVLLDDVSPLPRHHPGRKPLL